MGGWRGRDERAGRDGGAFGRQTVTSPLLVCSVDTSVSGRRLMPKDGGPSAVV